MLVAGAAIVVPLQAQQAPADPFGLTALNAAYRLKLGELSLDLQQGGMSHFQPYIHPLMSANGVELWGKDASFRADHLEFFIRYGIFDAGASQVRIRDTDVANLIAVTHASTNLEEHLGHQAKLRLVRDSLGPSDACARDSVITEMGAAIAISSTTLWRRNGGMVYFVTQVKHPRPDPAKPARKPELTAVYQVVRSGSQPTPAVRRVPSRTDAGCSIERDELERLAVPLDSAAFATMMRSLARH